MKLKLTIPVLIFLTIGSMGFLLNSDHYTLEDDASISHLLLELGDSVIQSKLPNYEMKGVSADKGKEIITNGFTQKPNGGTSGKQSSHFICTSCHNVEREDPDLAKNDPQRRLEYTNEKKMPFLQGTTLFGAVNRETYYNGDYKQKYGELVTPARKNIREAIQLCAVECAQGRALKDWEIESILAYLWKIDLKVKDLAFSDNEKSIIEKANANSSNKKAIELIKSKYLLASTAHFTLPPVNRKEGYGYTGKPENGKLIYENSCLHCHFQQKYSFQHLDKGSMSKNHLAAKIGSYSRKSIYQVIRWGVPTKSGKKSYMPQYTSEKMSDQMVEDLRAYLEE